MKTAVIYARYSSDSQSEQSIDGQLRFCKEYAERENIKIVDTYISTEQWQALMIIDQTFKEYFVKVWRNRKKQPSSSDCSHFGAEGGSWTHKTFQSLAPETSASAIPPLLQWQYYNLF